MGDLNLKLFFVDPCLNPNGKLVQLPLFLFSLFPQKAKQFLLKKSSNGRKVERAIHSFFLNVSKKVKRLGTPKIGGRGFLISLEKGVTPLETLYQF